MTGDYIPVGKNEKATWARTGEKQIDKVAAAMGLSADDVTAMKKLYKNVYEAVSACAVAQATCDSIVSENNKKLDDSIKALRGFVKQIKANRNYSEDMGEALGIVTSHHTLNADDYKPHIKALVLSGHVTIKFIKKGIEGVNVYSRLSGEVKWTKLSYDTHSPYVDNRPLAQDGVPEKREYMCIGVKNDKEIGQMSDIVEVLFGG